MISISNNVSCCLFLQTQTYLHQTIRERNLSIGMQKCNSCYFVAILCILTRTLIPPGVATDSKC